ncbi:MAG: ParA family protein [Zoogloeaceae bacterium]|nr:ParA family protein [Zoogloeaceae bacterium]
MTVVAFANQKGGTGKTTLLMNVAAALHHCGRRVAILDADPQGTASRWSQANRQQPFPVPIHPAGRSAEEVTKAIKSARRGVDLLLVDCPPSVEGEETRAAVSVSDWVVIPVAPSPPDLWATRGIVHLMAALPNKGSRRHGLLVANRVPPRSALGRDVLELLAEFEFPLARTAIGARAAYAQAAALGCSVLDLKRADAACAEIQALTEELLSHIDGARP